MPFVSIEFRAVTRPVGSADDCVLTDAAPCVAPPEDWFGVSTEGGAGGVISVFGGCELADVFVGSIPSVLPRPVTSPARFASSCVPVTSLYVM